VSIEKYLSVERQREDFYLFLGQLTGYKRADIAIEACAASGRRLVLAGGGGASKKDFGRYRKSPLVTFTGRVSDEEVISLLSRARALLFPGIEDFGLVPVEANAAGCPVIAYRKGGALDTIKENVTGIFFDEQTPESLIRAMETFEATESSFWVRSRFTDHVLQFSKEEFKKRMADLINEHIGI
jgi:glycosyltransferase involved in cell wall biosynthesis